MTSTARKRAAGKPSSVSVFAGCDIGQLTGLALLPDAPRPRYEDDVWDLTGMQDAHRMVPRSVKVWDFTTIVNPQWRPIVKDLMIAMLAPRHDQVLVIPSAVRTPRSPLTCHDYLWGTAAWLNWLSGNDVASLSQVAQQHCDGYLDHKSWSMPDPHGQRRRLDPISVSHLVRCMQAIAVYGELFHTDRYQPGFVPWDGRSANTVSGHRTRKGENSTPVVDEAILRPLLANCLYLIQVVGPHLADLVEQTRTDRDDRTIPHWLDESRQAKLRRYLKQQISGRQPLPQLDDKFIAQRLSQGWSPDDPLLGVHISRLLRDAGCAIQYHSETLQKVRPYLEEAVGEVGVAPPWARDAALVAHAATGQPIAWTEPLLELDLRYAAGYFVIACLILTAAVTGMRRTELTELVAGCRRHTTSAAGTQPRHRLVSRLIKGQPFGGISDEWVVVEAVDHAIALAERLTGAAPGQPLFGDAQIALRYASLRQWTSQPFATRLGLAPLPTGTINARMLRRTLAVELSRRPGGLLATKLHLRHVSVATTEGYTHRPGGSQALFHNEVEQLELEHHIGLTVQAFRDYQNGVLPAGPGARDLVAAFAQVDAELGNNTPGDPVVLDNDRRIQNLLRQQAATLHLGAANYCWFRDPAKALCLKLAGTPNAPRPLIGMCDSARCPQATHHPCHRPIWQNTVDNHTAFLTGLSRGQSGERQRLHTELARAQRVLHDIDTATTGGGR